METATQATAQLGSRPDIDIEPAGTLQPASPQASNPNPTPVRGTVVRDLPPQKQVEQSSIVKHSDDHIGEVFAALAKAQGSFGEIERTLRAKIKSDKADYSYDYAPLDEVLQAVRPALSENGLSLMQFPFAVQGAVTVRTMLGHSSGGWFYNDLRVASDGNDARSIGSAITYARRYAVMSMLGVAPSVDDDGAASMPKGEPPRAGQRQQPPPQAAARAAQPAPAPRPVPAPVAAAPAPAAQPDEPAAAKPTGRATGRVRNGTAATQAPAPQETSPASAVPPAVGQAAAPVPTSDIAVPAPVGRIVELQEKVNGALVTLDTGFRAASKDEETTKALRAFRAMPNAVVRLQTRPSSDPTRFAPVVTRIDLVARDREPGEEG